jgi:MSHA biogenesis protein MshJ
MKAWWIRAATRVNAMTLRERALLFVSVVAALGAATHLLFIAPLTRLQAQQAAQLDVRSADMEQQIARNQLEILERRRDRARELATGIAGLQGELDELEREIAALSRNASEAVALPAMLRRVLRHTDKVALLRVASAGDAGAAPAAGAAGLSGGGLDITLSGGYLDLMEYVATLEAALPLARWSALRVSAETVPARVSVRMVTPRGGS